MAANGVLNREQVLGGRVFRFVEVEVGEGKLRLRKMSGKEMLELQKMEAEQGEQASTDQLLLKAATLVAMTAVDGDGAPLFQKDEAAKIVETLSADVLFDGYRALLGLSGLAANGVAKLGERSAETAPSASSTA